MSEGLPSTLEIETTSGNEHNIRAACLQRDAYRRMITQAFDASERTACLQNSGNEEARDDDGHLLNTDTISSRPLEMAHIIPRSIWTPKENSSGLVSHFLGI